MTKLLTSFGLFCALVTAAVVANASMMGSATVVPTGMEKWTNMHGMVGVQEAVLYGNPSGTGLYVERLRATQEISVPPHTHPNVELVTVLAGSVDFATGVKVDWSKAKTVGAGSFAAIPAGVPHYVRMKPGTVLEISGQAPDTIQPVKMSSM